MPDNDITHDQDEAEGTPEVDASADASGAPDAGTPGADAPESGPADDAVPDDEAPDDTGDADEDDGATGLTALGPVGAGRVHEIDVPVPAVATTAVAEATAAGEDHATPLPGAVPATFWSARWTAAAVLWGLAVVVSPWAVGLVARNMAGGAHWVLPQCVTVALLVATVLVAPVTWRHRLWAGLAGPVPYAIAGALLAWSGLHQFRGTGFSAAWLDGFWLRNAVLDAVLAGATMAAWFVLRRLLPGAWAFVVVTMAFVFFLLRLNPQGIGADIALALCGVLGALVGQLITGRRRIPTGEPPAGVAPADGTPLAA